MRRAAWMWAPILLGGVSGCVPLFYAYPAVSYVPAVNVGKSRDKTYAFRVDIVDRSGGDASADSGCYLLRQIQVAKSGFVVGQAKLAIDSGFYWNCFVKCFKERTNHTVRLRFYRPGYNPIEIRSWQTEADVSWHETPGLLAREKALDALLRPSSPAAETTAETDWGFDRLAPGSASVEHRSALLFAAAEYERLAVRAEAEGEEETRDRCHAKAQWLHERASHL